MPPKRSSRKNSSRVVDSTPDHNETGSEPPETDEGASGSGLPTNSSSTGGIMAPNTQHAANMVKVAVMEFSLPSSSMFGLPGQMPFSPFQMMEYFQLFRNFCSLTPNDPVNGASPRSNYFISISLPSTGQPINTANGLMTPHLGSLSTVTVASNDTLPYTPTTQQTNSPHAEQMRTPTTTRSATEEGRVLTEREMTKQKKLQESSGSKFRAPRHVQARCPKQRTSKRKRKSAMKSLNADSTSECTDDSVLSDTQASETASRANSGNLIMSDFSEVSRGDNKKDNINECAPVVERSVVDAAFNGKINGTVEETSSGIAVTKSLRGRTRGKKGLTTSGSSRENQLSTSQPASLNTLPRRSRSARGRTRLKESQLEGSSQFTPDGSTQALVPIEPDLGCSSSNED